MCDIVEGARRAQLMCQCGAHVCSAQPVVRCLAQPCAVRVVCGMAGRALGLRLILVVFRTVGKSEPLARPAHVPVAL